MALNAPTGRSLASRIMRMPLLPLLFGAAGAWSVYIAANAALQEARFEAGTLHAAATVLPETSGASMSQPYAEFTDADGRVQRVRFRVHSEPPIHHAGEQVDVLYHRGNPLDARIDSFLERRMHAVLSSVMSLVFFFLAWRAATSREASHPRAATRR